MGKSKFNWVSFESEPEIYDIYLTSNTGETRSININIADKGKALYRMLDYCRKGFSGAEILEVVTSCVPLVRVPTIKMTG